MLIKGIIFDLDGVLVSTDECHYQAWKCLADAENIYFDRGVNHRLRGVGRMDSLNIILEQSHKQYAHEQRLELAAKKNSIYRELINELTPKSILPGASEILHKLKVLKLKTAIASSSKNAKLILDKTKLWQNIDLVVDGNDIIKSKPDPEIFLLTAQRLNLKPCECIVVEDAPSGIEAAMNAGMKYLAIGPAELFPAAKYHFSDLTNLPIDILTGVCPSNC